MFFTDASAQKRYPRIFVVSDNDRGSTHGAPLLSTAHQGAAAHTLGTPGLTYNCAVARVYSPNFSGFTAIPHAKV